MNPCCEYAMHYSLEVNEHVNSWLRGGGVLFVTTYMYKLSYAQWGAACSWVVNIIT